MTVLVCAGRALAATDRLAGRGEITSGAVAARLTLGGVELTWNAVRARSGRGNGVLARIAGLALDLVINGGDLAVRAHCAAQVTWDLLLGP